MGNKNSNLIIVYYARPAGDYFPSSSDCNEDWMIDTASHYRSSGLNDQGLYDSLLLAGLSKTQCDKIFDLADKRDIDLDMAECIWGSWLSIRPNKTTTQTFNALNNDLATNNIPVKFVCNWVF